MITGASEFGGLAPTARTLTAGTPSGPVPWNAQVYGSGTWVMRRDGEPIDSAETAEPQIGLSRRDVLRGGIGLANC